ncbi:MAG: mechanosensitive ion channel [Micromonosporaceae bacterium]|nr:mechanosensitive ion channel [Micromonosporaceae bacterium]
MLDRIDLPTGSAAAVWVLGGAVVGVVLRVAFGWLARRAARTENLWDDLGWRLLKDLAVPAALVTGVWFAAETLTLPRQARLVVDRALFAVIVLVVAFAAARIAASVVRTIALARSGVAQSATIFVNITRVVIIAIGVLVLLQTLGVSITPLLTALGVGGLAVALALQDTLSNLFAGVQVLASKKVQPGDFILLASGEDGYVVDINWRNTTIRQLAGNIVIVPNAHLADTVLTNFHQPVQELDVMVAAGVSYDSDLEHVERVAIEVARDVMATVEGGVPDYEPFVRFHTFGESSVDFNVFLQANEYSAQFLIKHEFVKRLHARFRAEGIEIPFPIRTVMLSGDAGSGAVDPPVRS